MQCPKCGYMLDAFEDSCPRWKRMGASAGATVATSPAPPQSLEPGTPCPPVRQQLRQEPIHTPPQLGWPLTILLYMLIVMDGGVLLLGIFLLLFSGYLPDMFAEQLFDLMTKMAVVFPGIRLIPVIGILKCQRWAFYVFSVLSVFPAVQSLMWGRGLGYDFSELFTVIIPAILVFILVLTKWNEFES